MKIMSRQEKFEAATMSKILLKKYLNFVTFSFCEI